VVKHLGSSDQPFTYVGRHGVRQEGETGLYHMRARFYDSLTGRFLSRDPIWSDLIEDPRSVNPYQYAVQNPLSFIDPSGQLWVDTTGKLHASIADLPDGTVVGATILAGQIQWGIKLGDQVFKLHDKWIKEWQLPKQIKPEPEGVLAQRVTFLKPSGTYDTAPRRVKLERLESGQPNIDLAIAKFGECSCMEYVTVAETGDLHGGCSDCALLPGFHELGPLLAPWLLLSLPAICLWAVLRWVAARRREKEP
jgi:RHS repeat-associated protein